MEQFKVVEGFSGKYEIGQQGTIRNSKTKKVTRPYHTSESTGPMVHLLNVKTKEESRVPVLKLVKEVWNKSVKGWENVDVDKLEIKVPVHRARKSELAQENAEQAVEEVKDEVEAKADTTADATAEQESKVEVEA